MSTIRQARNSFAILAFTALFGCSVSAPATTPTTDKIMLDLHSTHATQPLTRELTQHYANLYPEIHFNTSINSYGMLLEQLNARQINYFISSHIPASSGLWAAPIAREGIAIVVHPDNPIENITLEDIRSLFNQSIGNWSSLNGIDQGITPITFQNDSDSYAEFLQLVMGRSHISTNAHVVPNVNAMISKIANTPDSIGYMPFSQVNDRVRVVPVEGVLPTVTTMSQNEYPLRSTIFVIGHEEPIDAFRAFFGWIQSTDGQAIVGQSLTRLP